MSVVYYMSVYDSIAPCHQIVNVARTNIAVEFIIL